MAIVPLLIALVIIYPIGQCVTVVPFLVECDYCTTFGRIGKRVA